MKTLFAAAFLALSLSSSAFANEAFVCESRQGADDWYITGTIGASSIEVDQDELGQSVYGLKKVRKEKSFASYTYENENGNGDYLFIHRYEHQQDGSFNARLFAKDSKDVFDHVYFECKIPQPVTF